MDPYGSIYFCFYGTNSGDSVDKGLDCGTNSGDSVDKGLDLEAPFDEDLKLSNIFIRRTSSPLIKFCVPDNFEILSDKRSNEFSNYKI